MTRVPRQRAGYSQPICHDSHSQSRHMAGRMLSAALLVLLLTAVEGFASPQSGAPENRPSRDELSAVDIAKAQQLGQTLGIADWLGPLAPVALSPFFGIACLSGMSLYGRGWVSPDNAFLGEASPLNHQSVFVVFLILTVLTSLPRLTKVSKPFAQAVDQVEAWAGIITMLVLRFLIQHDSGGEVEVAAAHSAVFVMSPLTFTVNTLLAIAAVINVFVINTVKFFFEVLIWITPVPTIDAIFEVANKTVCAVLMAIYGYSPTLATVINLALFLAAALVFRWIYRREVFFRTMLMDACRAAVAPPGKCPEEISVFPVSDFGPFAARSRCRLQRRDSGWRLVQAGLISQDVVLELDQQDCQLEIDAGYFTNALRVSGVVSGTLTFSRLHNHQLSSLSQQLHASWHQRDVATPDTAGLRAELS